MMAKYIPASKIIMEIIIKLDKELYF